MWRDRALTIATAAVTAAVAIATFLVAYDGGGYAVASRNTIAIAVWWMILVGVAAGFWSFERVPRGAVVTGGLLALFAGWSLASTAWASSAEDAFAEFDRTLLYLGVYVLTVVAAGRGQLARWVDGLTLAIAAIALVALVSRLVPGSFPSRDVAASLPNASARLSFPLGYWNGLGIFVALGFPLLLHSVLGRRRLRRLTAVGLLPALGGVVYLTSSRGAVAALAGGILVFLLAEPRRAAALGATLAAAAGTAMTIAVLASRHELVDGPLEAAAARTQGWEAAVFLCLICTATAAAFEAAARVTPRFPVPARWKRRLYAGAIAAVVVTGLVAVYEARPLDDFTRLPTAATSTAPGGSGGDGLVRSGGSGRWQFWEAALGQFRSAPLHGAGAGSYEAWWAKHGSFAYYVKDAHSLYLETLGELGAVGFLLLAGALAAGVAVAVRRLVHARDDARTAIAGLLGAFAVYLIGAGVDWMWELTAVTVVGMCVLGLLTGRATPAPAPSQPNGPARRGRRLPVTLAAVVAAGAIVVAEAIPLLADVEVRRSQDAFRAGRLPLARSHAVAATKIERWAASPYLQLALVEEDAGNLAAARRAIAASIRRDRENWRPWFVAARIESRLGESAAAARSLARARSLNPRSPLFSRHR